MQAEQRRPQNGSRKDFKMISRSNQLVTHSVLLLHGLLISLSLSLRVCACMCVCVCVWERERDCTVSYGFIVFLHLKLWANSFHMLHHDFIAQQMHVYNYLKTGGCTLLHFCFFGVYKSGSEQKNLREIKCTKKSHKDASEKTLHLPFMSHLQHNDCAPQRRSHRRTTAAFQIIDSWYSSVSQ